MIKEVINLLSETEHSMHLSIISPYITVRPVKAIAKIVPIHTEIDIITDFNHDSFMKGSSSLGAFAFLASRARTRIFTVDRLHAKAYLWGSKALIGSANFTDRGLGFSHHANIEILTQVSRDDESIKRLLNQIEDSKKPVTQNEIQKMIFRLSSEKTRQRTIIRQRVRSVLSRVNWVPSCSLRYLIQYLSDGSLYKVPLISRSKINDDARFLENHYEIKLADQNIGKIVGRIMEIPIVQLAVECRLRGDTYLSKCLKAMDVSMNQIDALENWCDFCISHISEDV